MTEAASYGGEIMGSKKTKDPKPARESDEPEESPTPVRGPLDATPENPVKFRYLFKFMPLKFRKRLWTGGRVLKPVSVVAEKQRKRGRQ